MTLLAVVFVVTVFVFFVGFALGVVFTDRDGQ